jgi:hypothetical protein
MEKALRETEAWFVERGLPSFSRRPVPRSAKKVAGLLTVVATLEAALTAPSASWSWWTDLAVLLVVSIVTAKTVSAGVKAEQRRRGGKYGRFIAEAVFVAVPGVLSFVLVGLEESLVVASLNAVVLTAIAVEQRFRFLAVVRWCLAHSVRQVKSATKHLSRSVPLLTVLVLSLFYTAEVWQVSAAMRNANLVAVVAVLSVAGVLYSVVQLRSGLAKQIHAMDTTEELRGTPAYALGYSAAPETPLTRTEDLNVNALLVASQLCIVVVTALAFACLIVLFGSIAIAPDVITTWTGHEPGVLLNLDWGIRVCLTQELVGLGVLMAGVSSLVFAVSLTGDEAFQDLTRNELSGALTSAFAARNIYLAAFSEHTM